MPSGDVLGLTLTIIPRWLRGELVQQIAQRCRIPMRIACHPVGGLPDAAAYLRTILDLFGDRVLSGEAPESNSAAMTDAVDIARIGIAEETAGGISGTV